MEVMQYFQRAHLLRTILNRRTAMESGLFLGQLPMLEYIWLHDGCTQVEVAQALDVSAASVAVSTKRLQKAGLLVKKTDEKENSAHIHQSDHDENQNHAADRSCKHPYPSLIFCRRIGAAVRHS